MVKKEYSKPEAELTCFDAFIRTSFENLEENETTPIPFPNKGV